MTRQPLSPRVAHLIALLRESFAGFVVAARAGDAEAAAAFRAEMDAIEAEVLAEYVATARGPVDPVTA